MPDPKKKKKKSTLKKASNAFVEGLVRSTTPIVGKKNVNKVLYGRDLSTPLATTPNLKQSKKGILTGVVESIPAMVGPLKRKKKKK